MGFKLLQADIGGRVFVDTKMVIHQYYCLVFALLSRVYNGFSGMQVWQ
jgi:hypothetical protein